MSQRCQGGGTELLPGEGTQAVFPKTSLCRSYLEEAQVALGRDHSTLPPPPSGPHLHPGTSWPLQLGHPGFWSLYSFSRNHSGDFCGPDLLRVPARYVAFQARAEITTTLSEPRFLLPQPSLTRDQSFSVLKKSFWLVGM